ncbi:MAG: cystathionine beta-lyase [Alphaproteobacteria bacterium]|nr:cystathionine beta-lyase [Alphaproteobacteria bacterium]
MKTRTKLISAGRPHARPSHPVNPPVERASTVLFPTYDDFLEGKRRIAYGRLGTSTHRALEEAISVLEHAFETRLAPSGLQAVIAAMLAFVEAGDDILITDGVYDPTRKFADRFLRRFGVNPIFYDPVIGEGIADLFTPRTKAIVVESPSSLTFETQDLPAIVAAARGIGARVIVDNTWSAGVYFQPLTLGADVSVQACTKYLCGHSDCLVGSISSADEKSAQAIFHSLLQLGANVSADDASLVLRGMRTLHVRMPTHEQTALKLAKWLGKRPEVARVLHPSLKSTPGHAVWKRDFSGSSGLFGVVLKPTPVAALKAFFNALRHFGMGFSWGGYESLCIHVDPDANRSATDWKEDGPTLRFHAGLEDVEDLVMDLERAFEAMALARAGRDV